MTYLRGRCRAREKATLREAITLGVEIWQIVFRRFSGCSQGEMKRIWYNLFNDISLVHSTCPETTCHFYNPFTLGLPIEVQSY